MFNDIGLYDPVWASQYIAVHVVWEGLALVVTYRQQVSVTRCDSWSSHHSPSVGDQSPWCVDWNRPPSTHLSFVLTPLSYSSVCYRLNVCPPQNSSVEIQSANLGWWWGMRHHGGGQEVRALWSKIGKPMKVVQRHLSLSTTKERARGANYEPLPYAHWVKCALASPVLELSGMLLWVHKQSGWSSATIPFRDELGP